MSAVPTREETEEYLKWLNGWKGDTPTKMILTAPPERQDFWLWRRNKITGQVDLRVLDMLRQYER